MNFNFYWTGVITPMYRALTWMFFLYGDISIPYV